MSRSKPVAIGAIVFAAMSMLGGCSATEGGNGASEGRVYLSVPLSGPDRVAGRDIADGARLALEQAGGEAGGVEVTLELLDDAGPAGWDAAQVGENARAATEDAAGLAYIGDFTSGATRVSLPLTNGAGLLQVSPSASAMDLIREPGTLSDPNETYAVNGQRTFVRIVPADERQAQAAAELAERSGLRRVVIANDGSAYGDVMADAFEERASELGLGTTDAAGDPLESRRAGEEAPLALDPSDIGSYLAVESEDFEPNSSLPSRVTIEPDSLLGPSDRSLAIPSRADAEEGFVRGAPAAVSGAVFPQQLNAAGEAFAERFEDVYGRKPGRYGAYGYESMALVLDAIDRAGDGGARREDIVAAAFDTRDRDSVIGTYSIDGDGETTLEQVGIALSFGGTRAFFDGPGARRLPAESSLPELRRQLGQR